MMSHTDKVSESTSPKSEISKSRSSRLFPELLGPIKKLIGLMFSSCQFQSISGDAPGLVKLVQLSKPFPSKDGTRNLWIN